MPEIRAVGPKTLVPGDLAQMGVRVCHDMAEGIRDADVIIMLRLQNERMSGAMLPSAAEFAKSYGLTPDKLALAKPDAIVMHPGPINRGVEIDSAVADGAHSVILPQVTFGIAVRMAVMSIIAGKRMTHEDPHPQRAASSTRPRAATSIGRPGHRRRRASSPSAASASTSTPSAIIDASGLVVAPGLVDLAARLREPGHEHEGMLKANCRPRPPAASPAWSARPTPTRRSTSRAWWRCSSSARASSAAAGCSRWVR